MATRPLVARTRRQLQIFPGLCVANKGINNSALGERADAPAKDAMRTLAKRGQNNFRGLLSLSLLLSVFFLQEESANRRRDSLSALSSLVVPFYHKRITQKLLSNCCKGCEHKGAKVSCDYLGSTSINFYLLL
jgi:hypothetical protein